MVVHLTLEVNELLGVLEALTAHDIAVGLDGETAEAWLKLLNCIGELQVSLREGCIEDLEAIQ